MSERLQKQNLFLSVRFVPQPAEEEEEEVVEQDGEAVIMVEEEEEEGVVVQEEEGSPAVIVEEVPSAQVEECYSAQVLVYDDGTYLMQDVAEEQEVVTEVAESGEFWLQAAPCWQERSRTVRGNGKGGTQSHSRK